MTLILVLIGGLGLLLGFKHRRPGLAWLGIGVLLFHALPMALVEPDAMGATLRAYADTAATIAGTGSLAWFLGYWLLARTVPATMQETPAAPQPRAGRILHGWFLAVLLGLIAMAPGGPLGFAEAGFLRLPVESSLFSLTYVLACLAAFTTTYAAAVRPSPPFLSMGLVLSVFWMLGGRTQLVITGIAFGLVFLGSGRMRLRSLFLPALAAGLLIALTLSFRLTLQGETTDLLAAARITLSQLSLLEGYALAARFAEEAGYQSAHYWTTLQQLLPRALFPEKPMQLSRELRLMAARDTLGGLTPGLAGEAFAAGGLICLSFTGIVFGGALALLDNAYRALLGLQPLAQALVASLIPLLAIFLLRGGLDTAVFRLAALLSAAASGAVWQAMHGPRPQGAAP